MDVGFLALSWDSHVTLSPNAMSLVESFGIWRCRGKAALLAL